MRLTYLEDQNKNMNATQRALQALLETLKAGDASSTPTAVYANGPGGILNGPQNPRIVNAMVMPHLGLQTRIPVRPSVYLNEQRAIFTGVTAGTGSNPTAVCDPWPTPGNLKMLRVTWPFGRDGFSTDTINLTDPRIGGLVNRADFRDFTLVGDPLNGTEGVVVPTAPGGEPRNPFQSELGAQMLKFKIGYFRKHGRIFYTGNPVNNVYQGSQLVYGEAPGLNILVNTGYQDANTGALAPAADSLVRAFNANVNVAGVALVTVMTGIFRRQDKRAEDAGLGPVRFAWVMPEQLFYELANVWPCAYQTYRCSIANNTDQRVINITDQMNMTNDMRNGNYLLIDGKQVEVIVDDAIAETDLGGGSFSAPIFLVPLTYLGGTPALYTEYFDFNNADSVEMRNAFGAQNEFVVTDNGRFFWVKRKNGACVSMDAVEMSRLILEVPFLAARLTGIQYTPIIQTVSGWTTDGGRFYNGGGTSTPVQTFYQPNVYSGV